VGFSPGFSLLLRAVALACAGSLSACALDFDRFTRTGGPPGSDGGPPGSDGGVTGRDAANPGDAGGGTTVAPCARPTVYAAVEQLDDDSAPGRIMRVSLAGGRVERCEDLTGRGRLNPYLRSVAVLPGGRIAVGSVESVQLIDEATDVVLGSYDITSLGRATEARDVFALEGGSGGYLFGAAVYDNSTTSDGVGRLLRVLRFRDESLNDVDAHDATSSRSPFATRRVASMVADPAGGDSVWVTLLPSGSTGGSAVLRVPFPGGMATVIDSRFSTSFRTSLATALTPEGNERAFAFTVQGSGSPSTNGFLLARTRLSGSASYTSALIECAEVCGDARPEYIHAVPDPEDQNRVIAVCGESIERPIVRASSTTCTQLAAPPVSPRGRLRVWRIAVTPGS